MFLSKLALPGSSILSIFKDCNSFCIPPVDVSSELVKLNPAYDAHVDAEVREWCLKFLDLQDSTTFKARHGIESKLGLIGAYVYPSISSAKLLPIAKFLCWFFLADDFMDSPFVSSSDLKNAALAYKLIFNEKYEKAKGLVESKDLLRQMEMFYAVYNDLLSIMNSKNKIRFRDSMIEVLHMFQVESSWLHKKLVPNMETYMWMREVAGGILPCFVAIDFLQGLELKEETVDHPLIQKMELIGIRHIALHNDMMSFRKEWTCKKYLNAVPLLAYTENYSLNEAVAKVANMVEDLEKEFAGIKLEISRSSDGIGFKSYVTGIETWMAGNVEWGWLTARYHGVGWVSPVEKSGTFSL